MNEKQKQKLLELAKKALQCHAAQIAIWARKAGLN